MKIFKHYRYGTGKNFRYNDFALPEKLQPLPLFLSALLHQRCLNPKIKDDVDFSYFNFVRMRQMGIVRFAFYVYPKIIDVSQLFGDFEKDEGGWEIGSEVNQQTVLPNSVPANKLVIDPDRVYLVDNGLQFTFVFQN